MTMTFLAQVHFNSDVEYENFHSMVLSFRGAERQRPSLLQQALRFQAIINVKRGTSELQGLNTEDLECESSFSSSYAKGVRDTW